MKLYETPQTKNASFVKARPIKPIGIFVHSTGASNPTLKRYVDASSLLGVNIFGNHWNKGTSKKSVHAFIGLDKYNEVAVCHTLPYNIACWGAGGGTNGSYNYNPQAHIQFEVCEGSSPRSGKPPTQAQRDYYNAAWLAVEEYCAYLCKLLNLPASSIVGHYEAAKRGYANNHSDPANWMNVFGDSMDKLRERVDRRLHEGTSPTIPEPEQPPIQNQDALYLAEVVTKNPLSLNIWKDANKGESLKRIPKGAYVEVLEEVDKTWAKVRYIGVVGYSDRQYLKRQNESSDVLYTATVKTLNPLSLNIWKDAEKGTSLAKIPKGATVDVLGEVDSTWARIRYNGIVGYSDRQYLKKQ